jgi:hypothetical protein
MSRHEILAKDPAHKVIVGWDDFTYFAQVIFRAKEDAGKEDKFALWIPTPPLVIGEVEDLARRIRNFADLTPDMRATLYGDKDEGR